MRSRTAVTLLCAAALLNAGCSENPVLAPASPAPAAQAESSPAPGIQPGTLTFDDLTSNGQAVSSYTERGFAIRARGGDWQAGLNYGNPRPFVYFQATGGSTVTGVLEVSGGGQTFSFESIDLYASTTPIPYTITGTRGGAAVFTIEGRLPNTFGQFRTVHATNASAVIDALTITLTNAAAPCCNNPMGLDNIVLK